MDVHKKQNLKRKRVEGTKEDLASRISGKMHHELHEVHHACKKAKTFETQKLVKRLKQLRQKNEDEAAIKDHEAQLEIIKTLDHNRLANTAFKTKLLKDKQLKENQDVQDALTKEIQTSVLDAPTTGTPQAKVQSRLLSSKIIASQVATSIATLKTILNPDVPPTKKARSESPEAAAGPAKSAKQRKEIVPTLAKEDEDEGSSADDEDSDGEADAGDAGWESGTVDGDDDSGGEASEGGEADGWESGSIHGSDSEQDDDDTDDDSGVKAPPKKSAKTASASSSKSKAESTFLPSLSMGYAVGSDASDIEDGPAVADPRKNRRGQRARRAIWEKKYGRGANHMKQEAIKEQERKAKAAAKQQQKSMPRPDSGWSNRKTPGGHQSNFKAPEPPKKQNVEKPLHPSWEAKRKLKEKQSDAIVASQGKKIKF
ncbi:Bud-site selection protein [Ephemerocybe angulata]|uniref:Bud-site selection protein n=1 Tax=Ephemerocybe angulata TaxID=980116 RepID=A0A8H6M9U3_9AGAR|nr:Bud-site selection protein [Tulosesus angulatus]